MRDGHTRINMYLHTAKIAASYCVLIMAAVYTPTYLAHATSHATQALSSKTLQLELVTQQFSSQREELSVQAAAFAAERSTHVASVQTLEAKLAAR